ncbi:GntR family transcriptional regulator [Paraburkholderia sp. MMS20-SJTN17]|uniref:GntR family transcriptional regulator n=1 Tax=Paraburkholderia translucens TaxID=2886945 RepID=A0ABS8KKI9_9BURK|nr:GntR family transcriptional regulator [Paraburkholderia sp. MMS20-SJTN17]MCC8405245.1 GntR family transcriptional regulator [Paraburkholderia sp. MMS20-SJTN17]
MGRTRKDALAEPASAETAVESSPDTETASGGARLSDIAYERILEGLFERKLPAGAFVSQKELVQLLGIPVAPLRDALRVLEAEGVLTIHPRSGIQFIKPGLELTRATYQFRSIIERAAIRVFAETAEEESIRSLEKRHLALVSAIEKQGLNARHLTEVEALETSLHHAVITSLGNPLVENSYRRMHNYLKLLRLERKLTAPLVLRTLKEHLAILEACRVRDPDAAEAAVTAHFAAALQRNLGMY